jgi:hypothetical protein
MFTGAFDFIYTNVGLNTFTLDDSSSFGGEAPDTFSNRLVYLQLIDGSFLGDPTTGNDYWVWPIVNGNGDELAFNFMTQDYAINAIVEWVSDDPQSDSIYEANKIKDLKDYAQQLKYQYVGYLAGNRNLKTNQNFMDTLGALQALIEVSIFCIANDDQYSSQQALNGTQYISDNPNLAY